jgi:hypothetical protein
VVNPHIYAADVSKYNYNPRDEGYHVAQATLALAYEQRTANLIAWKASGKCYLRHSDELSAEITKRLELSDPE